MFRNKLEFKGAVVGMLLGDACIANRDRKTAHLQLAHTKSDEEYVIYKAKMLNWLNETKCKEGKSTVNGKVYPYVAARTLSHPFYTKLGNEMYYDGRKTITEHLLKCLTPLGLALWYMDDGTLAGEVGFRCPFMCTHNFNKVENELIARMVHKKFGVTFRVTKKNHKDKTYFWLRLRRGDREKFFEIIEKFVPECMKRKIDPDYYINDQLYFEKNVPGTCIACGKDFLKTKRSTTTFCSHECHHRTRGANRKLNAKASAIIGEDIVRPS